MVGIGRLEIGQDAINGSGGRIDGGRGVEGQNGDRYGLNRWEDTVANVILGMEHNTPLASSPVL